MRKTKITGRFVLDKKWYNNNGMKQKARTNKKSIQHFKQLVDEKEYGQAEEWLANAGPNLLLNDQSEGSLTTIVVKQDKPKLIEAYAKALSKNNLYKKLADLLTRCVKNEKKLCSKRIINNIRVVYSAFDKKQIEHLVSLVQFMPDEEIKEIIDGASRAGGNTVVQALIEALFAKGNKQLLQSILEPSIKTTASSNADKIADAVYQSIDRGCYEPGLFKTFFDYIDDDVNFVDGVFKNGLVLFTKCEPAFLDVVDGLCTSGRSDKAYTMVRKAIEENYQDLVVSLEKNRILQTLPIPDNRLDLLEIAVQHGRKKSALAVTEVAKDYRKFLTHAIKYDRSLFYEVGLSKLGQGGYEDVETTLLHITKKYDRIELIKSIIDHDEITISSTNSVQVIKEAVDELTGQLTDQQKSRLTAQTI